MEQYHLLPQICSTLSDKFYLDWDYTTKVVAFCQIICFLPNTKSHLAYFQRCPIVPFNSFLSTKDILPFIETTFLITLDGCYFNLKYFLSDTKMYSRSGIIFLIGLDMLTWRWTYSRMGKLESLGPTCSNGW